MVNIVIIIAIYTISVSIRLAFEIGGNGMSKYTPEQQANIVGRVCMDQFMVDVTNIDGVKLGTEVVLLGRSGSKSIDADDMAQMIGSIGYEIVCDISKRVARKHVRGDI